MLELYLNNDYDLVTNAGQEVNRTYPRGLDVEIFSYNALENADKNATEKYYREHVAPYIYENGKIHYYRNAVDYSHIRITLDTTEDFEVIKRIYNEMYNGEHNFYLNEIVTFLDSNPQIMDINKDIKQKKLKE